MARKRYASPETVLQRAIDDLEPDDQRSHERAVFSLLSQGPLLVNDEILHRLQKYSVSEVRAELLAFLRRIVRGGLAGEVSMYGHVTFSVTTIDGRVTCAADGREARDLAILQTVMLLQIVGLNNVRICAAPDCQRMFVKAYRRTHCSPRCQKRSYMRQRRANERLKRERARQRRRAKGG